jgi:hypothetical protein
MAACGLEPFKFHHCMDDPNISDIVQSQADGLVHERMVPEKLETHSNAFVW